MSFFLLRLPPFYFLPFGSALFNSHSIARYILLFLFLTTSLLYKNKIVLDKRFIILLFLYFISSSLSIVFAVNVPEFLLIWKDVVFGLIFFFVTLNVLRPRWRIESIIFLLLNTIVVNIMLEFVIYFRPDVFFSVIDPFLYGKYTHNLLIQFNRGRYFVDMVEAALIPFVIYYLVHKKSVLEKIASFFMSLLMTFFAFVSSFRAQLVVALISLLGSGILITKKFRDFILLLLILFLVFQMITTISPQIANYNALNRLLLEEKSDVTSIQSRFFYWEKAVEMGLSSSLFGIGLGNYYDNLSPKQIITTSIFDPKNELMKVTAIHPHNVFFAAFAETGFFGLISLILLLAYFAIEDLKSFRRNVSLHSFAIISFWSLFAFSLVQPDTILQERVLFWFLRALIILSTQYKDAIA